jgi:hypothetical protein
MVKGWWLAAIAALLLGAGPAWGAERRVPDGLKAHQEMRQNIIWTVEGLSHLCQSKDRKLALTGPQAKRILGIYQELIAKKIILIEVPARRQERQRVRSGAGDHGERRSELADLTQFGNKKLAEIDAILTPEQVKLMDNLDFDAAKYGFIDFGSFQNSSGERPNPAQLRAVRDQLRAGRERQVKLNREVLELLKKY